MAHGLRRWQVITNLIKENGYTRGAELGVWKGNCFKYLINFNPELHLIGVDLYAAQPDNDGPEKWTPGENGHMWDHEGYFQDVMNFCEQHPTRTAFIRDFTYNAADQIDDDSLDFVFIDADHSENGVRVDIEKWAPKVRAGGMIIGHDINWPTVKRVVEEKFGKNYTSTHDNVWYTKK